MRRRYWRGDKLEKPPEGDWNSNLYFTEWRHGALSIINIHPSNWKLTTKVIVWIVDIRVEHKITQKRVAVIAGWIVDVMQVFGSKRLSAYQCFIWLNFRIFQTFYFREQRLAIKSELQIRKKAMADQEFPSQKIIDEFLNRPITLPKLDLNWKQPSVVKFLVRSSS